MAKYDPLRDFLRRQTLSELIVTFGEIERLVGPLPASGERPQYWANVRASNRPWREAWRAAGYDAFLIAGANKVRFVRQPSEARPTRRQRSITPSAGERSKGIASRAPLTLALPPQGLFAPARHRQPEWYEERRKLLLANAEQAMRAAHGVFDGPSIDFHQWAIASREAARDSKPARESFIRDVFGTLVSWGMHRMGPRGAKMPRFEVFHASIISAWPLVLSLWEAKPPLTQEQWATLERTFHSIIASTTSSSLVSKSKVLTHLLPKTTGVIDRQYTLRFLRLANMYTNNAVDNPEFEWALFREIHEQFFYPLIDHLEFIEAVNQWPPAPAGVATALMETPLKAADSLLVGYQRSIRQEREPL